MDAKRFYESPYSDQHDQGLNGVFSTVQAQSIVGY
jgi:hypothetical protein